MTPSKFWAKVQQQGNGCWPWIGCLNGNGYGATWHAGKNILAHRMAYMFRHNLDVLSGVVMHTCDNPPCCNPDHLILGTIAMNNADKVAKGRLVSPFKPGPLHCSAVLSEAIAKEIKWLYSQGFSTRKLAEEFGIGKSTVHTLTSGKGYF